MNQELRHLSYSGTLFFKTESFVLYQTQQREQVRVRKFSHVMNRKGAYQSNHSNVTSGEGKLRLEGTHSGQMGTCRHHKTQVYGVIAGNWNIDLM